MPTTLNDNLPKTLRNLRSRSLFVMRLDVRPLLIVGATPGTYRRIGVVPGGSFEGNRLSGQVLDGSSDWQTVVPMSRRPASAVQIVSFRRTVSSKRKR
jgi:Protein of unknown function (DUF3237)